jgi:hypothetical protein
MPDLRQAYVVVLEALKRDVWGLMLAELHVQTPMLAFPMRQYRNPIHSWRWA